MENRELSALAEAIAGRIFVELEASGRHQPPEIRRSNRTQPPDGCREDDHGSHRPCGGEII